MECLTHQGTMKRGSSAMISWPGWMSSTAITPVPLPGISCVTKHGAFVMFSKHFFEMTDDPLIRARMALGQTLAPIYLWANADGHLLVGQLLVTFNACLPQCLWYECLCQTACAQNACVNLLVASQKGKFACCQIACWTIACIQQLLVW